MATALITTTEAAQQLRIQPQTLRVWRLQGIGPQYVRLGGGGARGRVLYRVEDIDAWLASRTARSTSEETVAAERRAAGEVRP